MNKITPPRGNSAASRDIASVLHPYTHLRKHESQGPLVITEGKGIYVQDDAGKSYIEGLAGLWCTSLGFGEERLVAAAAAQMRKLPFYHVFAHKSHDVGIDLAERLLAMMPVKMSKVFFNNSGSEANDTAVKMVWYYNNALNRPRKKKIIARVKGYHGVTVAAASLTGLPNNHLDFDLPIANIRHADCPHFYRYGKAGESEEDFATRMAESLEAQILREGPDTVAAFIAEPIMGAGGVILPPKGYWEKVQAVCRKHDVLVVADEVICGFGRTGKMFACDVFGIKPDILVLSKAITSSYMPLSAVLVSDAIYQAVADNSAKIGVFGHGFTAAGHPVATAVAMENLDIIEERGLVEHAAQLSAHFLARIHGFAKRPLVGETRGIGLLGAVELVANKETKAPFAKPGSVGPRLQDLCQEEGLIIRGIGEIMAFCPPLIITKAEVDQMFDRFDRAMTRLEAEMGVK